MRACDDDDELELLLAEALEALERDGRPGLEAVLARHPQHEQELRNAIASLGDADLLVQPEPESELPTQLGDFAIKRQLGAGGMGVVFVAEQKSLGREVALKIIRPELLLFEGSRERFRREIEAVARLEHAAIVPILATGHDNGVPYYVMPLLRGATAEAVVAQRVGSQAADLSGQDLRATIGAESSADTSVELDTDATFAGSWWQAAVRLMIKAALGIQHAHTRGILHRDIKPSNIALTPAGQAIVLDFGLAQARQDDRLTQTGSAAGSPAYMAPEQIRAEHADEQTDVYGLAATLHSLLGLRVPFARENADELRSRILAGEALPLTHSGAPHELEIVLRCAMDIERRRRYPTARAFAEDLQAVIDGRPILARRLPASVRLRRFVRRHPTVSVAVAIATVFLIATPTILLFQQQRANQLLTEQVRRADASVMTSIAAVNELLANVGSEKLRNLPGAQVVARDVLIDALELFNQLDDEQYADQITVSRVSVLTELAIIHDMLGDPSKSNATSRRALAAIQSIEDAGEQLSPRIRHQQGILATNLASGYHQLDQQTEAAPYIQLAEKVFESNLEAESFVPDSLRQLASLQAMRAENALRRGNKDRGEACLRRAVALSKEAAGERGADRHVYNASLNLAQLLQAIGKADEGKRITLEIWQDEAFAKSEERGWPVPRMVRAKAAFRLQQLAIQAKDAAEARRMHGETIAVLDELLRDYPYAADARRLRAITRGNLAKALGGKSDAARQMLRQAVADLEFALASNPWDRAAARFLIQQCKSLSWALRQRGDWLALEDVARRLGRLPGGGTHRETAARDLLRCAKASRGTQQTALREEALQLLLDSHRAGAKVLVDDPLYEPIKQDPRYAELRQASSDR